MREGICGVGVIMIIKMIGIFWTCEDLSCGYDSIIRSREYQDDEHDEDDNFKILMKTRFWT